MFRKFLIFVFAISVLTQARLGWGVDYNFRSTNWGMSQEEVISSEEKLEPVDKTENVIKYKTQILGKNVNLVYLFAQNKLIGSSYRLEDNYLNSQHFINTYNEFKRALMDKYGQPDKETKKWLNPIYKNDRKKWGLALSLGHLEYAVLWKAQNATIECRLRALNYYVLCSVEYKSTNHSSLFPEINKEDKLDPL
jgi:hypothetical protein